MFHNGQMIPDDIILQLCVCVCVCVYVCVCVCVFDIIKGIFLKIIGTSGSL